MTEITLGGRYTDEHGTYTVLNLCGSLVKVMYADGYTVMMPRSEHKLVLARIEREVQEKAALQRYLDRKVKLVNDVFLDPYTLGFLAAKGWLYAKFPPEHEKMFVEAHKEITGLAPDPEFYHVTAGKEGEWNALSSTIEFPLDDLLDFGELEIHEREHGRGGVYSNKYFWALLFCGFRLGRKHDIDRITESVSAIEKDLYEYQRGFLKGEK